MLNHVLFQKMKTHHPDLIDDIILLYVNLNSFIKEMLQTYPKASPIQFFSFSPRYNNLFIHLFIHR